MLCDFFLSIQLRVIFFLIIFGTCKIFLLAYNLWFCLHLELTKLFSEINKPNFLSLLSLRIVPAYLVGYVWDCPAAKPVKTLRSMSGQCRFPVARAAVWCAYASTANSWISLDFVNKKKLLMTDNETIILFYLYLTISKSHPP
jgi:hypothetical protein